MRHINVYGHGSMPARYACQYMLHAIEYDRGTMVSGVCGHVQLLATLVNLYCMRYSLDSKLGI